MGFGKLTGLAGGLFRRIRGGANTADGDGGNTGAGGAGRGGNADPNDGGGGSGGAGGVWLIVGLGNPGSKYEGTRHNVGFRAIDKIAAATGIEVRKGRFRSLIGEGRHRGRKLVLQKPQTYMNSSGEAVGEAFRYYRPPPERMILIYDDVDIAFGSIRIRASGSPGTHNGMRSVRDCLGDDIRFPRVRIGIGRQPERMDISDYVLSRFSGDERATAEAAIGDAAEAALRIVEEGVERAVAAYGARANNKKSGG